MSGQVHGCSGGRISCVRLEKDERIRRDGKPMERDKERQPR